MLFVDDNQCIPLLDILNTVVPVRLVVKIGVLSDEDNNKAAEYNIPVSISNRLVIRHIIYLFVISVDCVNEDSRE